MPDILFVSLEDWDQIWRRNQFLCDALSRRYPEHKILFVGRARDFSNRVRRRAWRGDGQPTTWTVPGLPNVTVTRPLKLLPNTLALGRRFNDWLARRQILSLARGLGLTAPLLWLNDHAAVSMVGRMGECATIYDVTDDWTEFPGSARERATVSAQDAQLCRVADATIVCSQRLFDRKRSLTESLHLIPNGVHAEHYARVLDGVGPLPAAAARWKRPVLGYVGSVHSSRVDLALLEAVAKRWAPGTIALVGPDFLQPADVARLDRLGNVIRVSAVPYAEVPDYMRAFDVSIVPHLVTPFTESLNPIKLWEYLAAGKPIVSTDVAGFRDYPQHVAVARSGEEFAHLSLEALSEENERREARRIEARAHSWDARVDQVVGVIGECVGASMPAVQHAN